MSRLTATTGAAANNASNGHIRPRQHPAFPSTSDASGNPTKLEDSVSSDDYYNNDEMDSDPTSDNYPAPLDPTLNPGGSRDLSLIGLQAFGCGSCFVAGLGGALFLSYSSLPWWRLPAFLACLSLFHFLEFWITARWNTPSVRASSFLLYNNGKAYTLAHSMATLEILVSQFVPSYQGFLVWPQMIVLGMMLILVGQMVRSTAMAQAGTNFAHILVTERKEDHELVVDGVYAYLRHPSYFGFFWWAIGTQLLVGNKICLLGYTLVLWKFFNNRIRSEWLCQGVLWWYKLTIKSGEEMHLVGFFDKKYVEYRNRTGTWIPLIR